MKNLIENNYIAIIDNNGRYFRNGAALGKDEDPFVDEIREAMLMKESSDQGQIDRFTKSVELWNKTKPFPKVNTMEIVKITLNPVARSI